jgi:uncharacterized surface protein with fasciclin (FAS1) repeats
MVCATVLVSAMAGGAMAEDAVGGNPTVGGAPMSSARTIAENTVNSRDHTTLVAAVEAAGLASTLDGPGPYTVFAPTNAAFAKLPQGTVDFLLKPENRSALVKLVTYHVVAGKLTEARLRSAIMAGGGSATLTTIEGEPLTATLFDDNIQLTDAKGDVSTVTIDNVMQANGVVHVVDTVLMP